MPATRRWPRHSPNDWAESEKHWGRRTTRQIFRRFLQLGETTVSFCEIGWILQLWRVNSIFLYRVARLKPRRYTIPQLRDVSCCPLYIHMTNNRLGRASSTRRTCHTSCPQPLGLESDVDDTPTHRHTRPTLPP